MQSSGKVLATCSAFGNNRFLQCCIKLFATGYTVSLHAGELCSNALLLDSGLPACTALCRRVPSRQSIFGPCQRQSARLAEKFSLFRVRRNVAGKDNLARRSFSSFRATSFETFGFLKDICLAMPQCSYICRIFSPGIALRYVDPTWSACWFASIFLQTTSGLAIKVC